jgi:hypothetical protein
MPNITGPKVALTEPGAVATGSTRFSKEFLFSTKSKVFMVCAIERLGNDPVATAAPGSILSGPRKRPYSRLPAF